MNAHHSHFKFPFALLAISLFWSLCMLPAEGQTNLTLDANGILRKEDSWWTGSIVMPNPIQEAPLLFWNPHYAIFRANYTRTGLVEGDFGLQSAAFGVGVARGMASFAAGEGLAIGPRSTALNVGTSTGIYSSSIGYLTHAIGGASFASGDSTTAHGWAAAAFGASTNAYGNHTLALGLGTVANAYASVALGQYNEGLTPSGANYAPWYSDPRDPVFEIGIGTASNRANALTVYKSGKITMKKQGDIKMGQFGMNGD